MKRSFIEVNDLSVNEIDELIAVSEDIIIHPEKYREVCKYKKLATLFFEPSTRTRLSFEAAMYELGGQVLGFSEAQSSSVSKGETVKDTVKMVSGYADIIAMRHFKDGAPRVATTAADISIINAGDGGHQHPTQTLADLFTIKHELGRLDGLKIGIVGDLKYGRTVHSLITAMLRYPNNEFYLVSPEELKTPDYTLAELRKNDVKYTETCDLSAIIPLVDVLYMTRVQRERFSDISVYERLKDSYILSAEKMMSAKEHMRILHPLPRVNEINVDVDNDERAAYFRQAHYGKYMRMALIMFLLDEQNKGVVDNDGFVTEKTCQNFACVSLSERGIVKKAHFGKDGKLRCEYCDQPLD